jgi:hypothetical protein
MPSGLSNLSLLFSQPSNQSLVPLIFLPKLDSTPLAFRTLLRLSVRRIRATLICHRPIITNLRAECVPLAFPPSFLRSLSLL